VRLHETGRAGSILLAAASLSALVGTGCYGTGSLSKSELVDEANAICKPHTKKIRAAADKLPAGGQSRNPRSSKLARGTIEPQLRAQITELRGLKPPDDLAKEYTKWLDDSDRALGRMTKDQSLITSAANFEAVNREAARLGMSRDCYIGPG
jgi:hypothetical protein